MKLAEQIKNLRGGLNYLEFSDKTGVNRNTLNQIEDGHACKISTLEEIAKACHVNFKSDQWLDLLIGWIRASIGEGNFSRLSIQKFDEEAYAAGDNRRLLHFFGLLSSEEQVQVLKTVDPARKEVRACLPSINRVWEKIESREPFKPLPNAQEAQEAQVIIEEKPAPYGSKKKNTKSRKPPMGETSN